MAIENESALIQADKSVKSIENGPPVATGSVWVSWAAALSIIGILCLVWFERPIGLTFKDNLQLIIPSLLGSMLIVALFVERAIEVFIAIFQSSDEAIHDQNLSFWQERNRRFTDEVRALVAERNSATPPDDARKQVIDNQLKEKREKIAEAIGKADVEEKALMPYKSATRRRTAAIGFVLGTLTASIGYRFLVQIVKVEGQGGPAADQMGWFGLVDVMLTGAVLSGGSQAVHEILSVYSQFMETTQKSVATKS